MHYIFKINMCRQKESDVLAWDSCMKHHLVTGAIMDFGVFEERFFRPHLLTQGQYSDSCRVTLEHDTALPKPSGGGDSVQGL